MSFITRTGLLDFDPIKIYTLLSMTERPNIPEEAVSSPESTKLPPVISQTDTLNRLINGGYSPMITKENFPDIPPAVLIEAKYFASTNRISRIRLIQEQNEDPAIKDLLGKHKDALMKERDNELKKSLIEIVGEPVVIVEPPKKQGHNTGQYL